MVDTEELEFESCDAIGKIDRGTPVTAGTGGAVS